MSILKQSDIFDLSETSTDVYVTLDIKNIFMKMSLRLANIFSRDQIKEIFRQIFQILRPEMNIFMQYVLSLPNFTLLIDFNHTLDAQELETVRNALYETSFEIYMSARQEGLFLGSEGENSFPFYLEQLTTNAAYLLLDKTAVQRYRQTLHMG